MQMHKVTGVLDIFKELPDYEQQLSIQIDSRLDLKTFTCFPELSMEVRLMIWRAAFPGRRYVAIGYIERENYFQRSPNRRPRQPMLLHAQRYFPVTSWICSESRHETLRHYTMCNYGGEEGAWEISSLRYPGTIPFCFYGERDVLYVDMRNSDPLGYASLLTLLRIHTPNALRAITMLEIRNWHCGFTDAVEDYENDGEDCILDPIFYLPCLKVLTFCYRNPSDFDRLLPFDPDTELHPLTTFFDNRKSNFENGPPKIILKGWKLGSVRW